MPWDPDTKREATELATVVLSVAALTAGFVFLPAPYDTGLLYGLFGFVCVVAPPANAYAKGFRWWLWAIPNLIGWITVFVLPSARDPDVSARVRAARLQTANCVGVVQTAVALVCMLAGLVRVVTAWW